MSPWLKAQLDLTRCLGRMLAALATGNWDAFDKVREDIDAIHRELGHRR
jgi:hypothetical protein